MGDHDWAKHLSTWEMVVLTGYPILSVLLIYVFINYWLQHFQRWGLIEENVVEDEDEGEVKLKTLRVPIEPIYGDGQVAGEEGETSLLYTDRSEKMQFPTFANTSATPNLCGSLYGSNCGVKVDKETRNLLPGEVGGEYTEPWETTFDVLLLMWWVSFFVVMLVLTGFMQPSLLTDSKSIPFWLVMIWELLAFFVVNLVGGAVARRLVGTVDDKGYLLTTRDTWFKINYTRKLQHFLSCFLPMVLAVHLKLNVLEYAWNHYVPFTYHALLIKPIREALWPVMVMFTAIDRPEDRPHTLKLAFANIVPGMFINLLLLHLFTLEGNTSVLLLTSLVATVGDGLAEPVGINLGKHKYRCRSMFGNRTYVRSWEGSACVLFSGIFFCVLMHSCFDSFLQAVVAMVVLGPLATWVEAVSPHTVDAPFLAVSCGGCLMLILHFVP